MDDSEFLNMMFYKIDPQEPVTVSEQKLAVVSEKFAEYLKNNDNCLRTDLITKVNVNPKQLRETFVNVGYKPDMMGNVSVIPVNNSYVSGVSNAAEYFINAVGTRKAIVTNFKGVRQSGYFTRKSQFHVFDLVLKDVEDCGTVNYVNVNVSDILFLTSLIGQNMITDKGLHVINGSEDYLIGKDISIRNSISCALSHKNGICKTCFGALHGLVGKLHTGIVGSLLLTNQITQTILSTKHFMRIVVVNNEKWDGDMYKYFKIIKNKIISKENPDVSFIINRGNVKRYRDKIYIHEFKIKHGADVFDVKFPLRMFLHESDIEEFSSNPLLMDKVFSSISLGFITENKEFYKNAVKILSTLDSSKLNDIENYSELLQYILSLLTENGVSINFAHLGVILNNSIRQVGNLTKKMDFSKPVKREEYVMTKISDAIMNASQFMCLSYEQIAKKIVSPEFYTNDNVSRIENMY
jgi:hypothetical protein